MCFEQIFDSCPFIKQVLEEEYCKAPRWEARTNINTSALELKQRKLSDTLGWLQTNEYELHLILRRDIMIPPWPSMKDWLMGSLGSLFILKVQRQKIVMYLGGLDSVPYHILHVTKKREMFVLSLLYRVSLMCMTSDQRSMFADLKMFHIASSASHIPLQWYLYSLLACSGHSKLQVGYNLYFQDRQQLHGANISLEVPCLLKEFQAFRLLCYQGDKYLLFILKSIA